jgi:hypothetical protein
MGIYGAIVRSPAYRDQKMRTVINMLPQLVGPRARPCDLRFNGPDGSQATRRRLIQRDDDVLTAWSRRRRDDATAD